MPLLAFFPSTSFTKINQRSHVGNTAEEDMPRGIPPTTSWHPSIGKVPCGPQALEKTALDNHPWTRQPLRKSRFPAEKFQHTTGETKQNKTKPSLIHWTGAHEQFDFTYNNPPLRQQSSELRESVSTGDFFWGGGEREGRKCVCERPCPQLRGTLTKRPVSLLPSSEDSIELPQKLKS